MPWHLGPPPLRAALHRLPLCAWRYWPTVGSTNDEALRWLDAGAPEGCLTLADEQTQGRGRGARRWWTPPGAALAFSLVVRPLPHEQPHLPRFTAWAAVALAETLAHDYGLQPQVKWPNDVLLGGRKVAGVLAEARWEGEHLRGVVVGVGVNLAPQAVPPASALDFPATSVAHALGDSPPRWRLLAALLRRMMAWRFRLGSRAFLQAWEARLAYRGQMVYANGHLGRLHGLDNQGRLRLQLPSGAWLTLSALQGHLRPAPTKE